MITMEGDPGSDHQAAPPPPLPATAAQAQAHQQPSTTTTTPYSWEITLSSLSRNSIVEDHVYPPPTFEDHTQEFAQWHSALSQPEGNFVLHHQLPPVESPHCHVYGPATIRNETPQSPNCFDASLIPSSTGVEILNPGTSPNSWIQQGAGSDFHSQPYPRSRTFIDTRGCASSDVGRSYFDNTVNGMVASSIPEPSTTENLLLHSGNHGLAVDSNRMEIPILKPQEEILSNTRNSWQVEAPNRHEPRRTRIDRSSPRAGIKSCTCKKSRCLMMFCVCFAAGDRCGDSCACKDCRNDGKYEDEVRVARTRILSRDPRAFLPKIIYTNIKNDGNRDTASIAKHWKGCSCKKSKCNSKYCECYAEKVGCSAKCRCKVCRNSFNLRKGTENVHVTKQKSDIIVSRSSNSWQEGPVNPTHPHVSNSLEGHSSIQMFQASSSNGLDQLPHMLQPRTNCHSYETGFTSNGFDFSTLGSPSSSELLHFLQSPPPHVPSSNPINGLPEYQGIDR